MRTKTTKKTVSTFTATIYVGFKNRDTGRSRPLGFVRKLLQDYVNRMGLCVTLTPTQYIYTNGVEPGCIIGLINYPRFPSSQKKIIELAEDIAVYLQRKLEQYRVAVVFPKRTVMFSSEKTVRESA